MSLASKLSPTYTFDPSKGVYLLSDDISYADGGEDSLYHFLSSCTDRSTFSEEISSGIVDWPSEYHLSRARHCLVRPLDIKKDDRVLELGAGCGVLTRYLGEIGAHVTAVEGSLARAQVIAKRCSDLDTITVLSGNFLDFKTEQEFDWILFVGVLEYASRFLESENPALDYLTFAKQFLKPSGKIVVAIENKLGIKYFNGCGEDHVQKKGYGIQNLYRKNEVQTFSKAELTHLLKKASLPFHHFFYPFPDYKLPKVILSGSLFKEKSIPASDLLLGTFARDYMGDHLRFFSENLVLRELEKDGVMENFANSFCVVASKEENAFDSTDKLAWMYSVVGRKKAYAAETTLMKRDNGYFVEKMLCAPEPMQAKVFDKSLDHHVSRESDYVCGRNYMFFVEKTKRRSRNINDWAESLKPWALFLKNNAKLKPGQDPAYLSSYDLDGSFCDAVPSNFIYKKNELHLIDQEWEIEDIIPLEWILCRGVFLAFSDAFDDDVSLLNVVKELSLSLSLTIFSLECFLKWENEFQQAVNHQLTPHNHSSFVGMKPIFDEMEKKVMHIKQNETRLSQMSEKLELLKKIPFMKTVWGIVRKVKGLGRG